MVVTSDGRIENLLSVDDVGYLVDLALCRDEVFAAGAVAGHEIEVLLSA